MDIIIRFNWKGVRQNDSDFPLVKIMKGGKNIRRIKYIIDLYILRIIVWGEKIELADAEGGYLLKEPYLSELIKYAEKGE